MTKHLLPLYYTYPVLAPCSRSAWFFTGFFFGALLVLALGVPSLFYILFNFLVTLFQSSLNYYKSETGEIVANYIKFLVLSYLDFHSTEELIEKMERGESMVPPLFIWIFQDYPEVAANLLRSIDPIRLNKIYDKLSEYFLDFVCIDNKFILKQFQVDLLFKFLLFIFIGSRSIDS